jgi:hypothetical protein
MAVVALSIKPGGCVRRIMIEGGIKTNGKGVPPIEMEGAVDVLNVGDGLGAGGGGF